MSEIMQDYKHLRKKPIIKTLCKQQANQRQNKLIFVLFIFSVLLLMMKLN